MKIASCPRIIAVSALLAISAVTSASELVRFWIGANQAGIYAGEIDVANGKINNLRPVVTGIDAYYIVKHPDKPILYAVIRTEGPSKIRSYRITESGDLELESELNDRPHGASHINISRNGRYLGVAYYRTGIAGVYNLTENGKIDSIFDEVRHEGTSINRERQEAPHPHWAGFSDDSLFMYVPDLGTDHIWVYKLDEEQRLLRLLQKAEAPPGSGPRHMAIHPKHASDRPLISG